MKKPIAKKGSNKLEATAIGASLAGLAAVAYFFLGPEGKKHQKNVKSWAIKMKGDVVEKLEAARNVGEPAYHAIIDSVAAKYEKTKKTSPEEIKALAQDLKKHWKTLAGSVKHETPKVQAKVSKTPTKTVKIATKKKTVKK
ncbi:MAG: hypothetical protein NT165_00335 [Candidatus Falkowbacteria bacterium]|nr:hypothetical protein [Candidatus Falkowbacteria bacterium]